MEVVVVVLCAHGPQPKRYGCGRAARPRSLSRIPDGATGHPLPAGGDGPGEEAGRFGIGLSSQAAPVAGTGSVSFCQGHRPVISNSREKLRNVRMTTITARTPTLVKVGVTATVRMMSAATRSSRPRRMDRPSNCRYSPVERPVWGTAAFSEVSAAYGQRHRDHGADDHDRHSREVQVPPGGFNNESQIHVCLPASRVSPFMPTGRSLFDWS